MLKKNQRDPQFTERGDAFDEASLEPAQPARGLDDRSHTPWRREPEQVEEQTPRAETGSRAESIVDAYSTFDGKYETEKDLRVFGRMSGEIICRGQLTIEREASAKARIEACDVIVRGRVEGELTCSGKLTIDASAVVNATIRTATLVVQEGATVRGNVETAPVEAVAPVPQSTRTRREPAAAVDDEPEPPARGAKGRDLPSFALVSSEERNPASAR
jgi:cytoskeletal protein CcmA (bactofilin family)